MPLDGNNPDLKALNHIFVQYFELENLVRMQHYCPLFVQTHQTLNWWEHDDAQQESQQSLYPFHEVAVLLPMQLRAILHGDRNLLDADY